MSKYHRSQVRYDDEESNDEEKEVICALIGIEGYTEADVAREEPIKVEGGEKDEVTEEDG